MEHTDSGLFHVTGCEMLELPSKWMGRQGKSHSKMGGSLDSGRSVRLDWSLVVNHYFLCQMLSTRASKETIATLGKQLEKEPPSTQSLEPIETFKSSHVV